MNHLAVTSGSIQRTENLAFRSELASRVRFPVIPVPIHTVARISAAIAIAALILATVWIGTGITGKRTREASSERNARFSVR